MKKQYFMIGNAHLDPVWQWCVPEGMALVKSTFQSALDRMEEFPDYVFTSACAGYYKWVAVSEPEMFEKIKQRIKEGRWRIVGNMWVQPDCNIPSGEAFARHLLYSEKFFKEQFGFFPKTGYNVDSFGHNGMLPQLFQKAGMENYVFHRPNPYNEKPNLPHEDLFWWESPDGSRVMGFRIPDGYGGDIHDDKFKFFDDYLDQPQMVFYGIGNHGGGPAVRHLQAIEERRAKEGKDVYIYAGPDEYFEYARAHQDEYNIPVVAEDLQHHASGCYAANGKIKQMNRRAENDLIFAEKLDVLSHVLTGGPLATDRITKAWERVMFNQFHDILAGCSIKPAYTDAYNGMAAASLVGMETATFAAERISWRVNTTKFFEQKPSEMRDRVWYHDGEGSPMVVFNPHSFPIKTNVCFGMQWVSGVVDSNDNDVPFQIVRAPYTDGWHYNQCMFEVELEPYGYATYYIFKDEQNHKPREFENEFTVTDTTLENSKVKLVFDRQNGWISEYIDKETGRRLNAGAFARCVVTDDTKPDTWAHNMFEFNDDIGVFSDAKIEIEEIGYLRATLRITSTYNKSTLVQYVSLGRGSKRVDVSVRLNFGEHFKIAKLAFPAAVEQPKAVYSMPFGFIEKEANGQEEPAHGWIKVCGADGANMALINDGKYSFCVKGNEMRMTIARGSAFLDHYGQQYRDENMQFHDQGDQEFKYAILPDCSNADAFKAAELLNTPAKLYNETHHKGTLPPVYSGMSVSAPNVIVQAVKASENGKGYVLRTLETAGEKASGEIDLKFLGIKIRGSWGPQEIKTFFVAADGSECREIMLTEQDL